MTDNVKPVIPNENEGTYQIRKLIFAISLSFRYRDDRLWEGLQNGNTGINTFDSVKPVIPAAGRLNEMREISKLQ